MGNGQPSRNRIFCKLPALFDMYLMCKDVLRLYLSVDDVLSVDIFDCFGDLSDDLPDFALPETSLLLSHHRVQISALTRL